MTKQRLKTTIRATIFIIVLVVIFSFLQWLIRPLDMTNGGKNELATLYAIPKNTVDVLVIGSSHEMRGINMPELYREYGISALQISASSTHPASFRYWIAEALKTQQPKLIIISLDNFVRLSRSGNIFSAKLNYIGGIMPSFHESFNKVDYRNSMIDEYKKGLVRPEDLEEENLVDEKNGAYTLKNYNIVNMTVDLFRYHDNWKKIDKTFLSATFGFKGIPMRNSNIHRSFSNNDLPVVPEKYQYSDVSEEVSALPVFNELVDFLEQEGCEYMFINMPTAISTNEGYSLDATGIPSLKLNTGQMAQTLKLDYDTDFYDKGHLNYTGSLKATSFIGSWLKESYDIPDRRGVTGYGYLDNDLNYYEKKVKPAYEKEMKKSLKAKKEKEAK